MMRMIARKLRRPIAVGLATLVMMSVPAVALAQTDEDPAPSNRSVTDRPLDDRGARDRGFDAVKERILAAIERRLEALERLSEAVASHEQVSANHAAHLQNDYRAAERILDDGAEAVQDAETFEELREVVPEIFEETLVFALLKPKTHLVVASDSMLAIYERVGEFADTLQMIIDRLSEQGHEMGIAQAALDEMVRLLDAAEALAEPVADDVVDLDPGDWPEPAQASLEQGRADLEAARELFREARGKAHDVIVAIREAIGGA